MRLIAFAAALSTAAHATAAPLPAQNVDATIDRAVAAYAKMKTARATFEQTLTNPLTGSNTVQAGELFQQGKRWSARFTNPRGDRYVLNGRTFWIYTPSSAPRQAIRLNLDEDGVAGFDVVQQLVNRPRDRFTIASAGSAAIGGRSARAIQLVPKEPGRLTKAVVWVDDRDGTVRQFELTESTGLVRRVRLSNIRLNATVQASEFAFTPPAGVRVVDQSAFTGTP